MSFEWGLIQDLGIIAAALLLATLLRARISVLQRFLIPNALTAGFLLFGFYNGFGSLLGLERAGLENLVFHLLNIAFIAMALRPSRASGRRSKSVFSTVTVIVSQLTFQAVVGFGLTFLLIVTFIPSLFPSFGFLAPLGFFLGPGQALSIGRGWESSGLEGAGSIGLTFGAIGFLWACIGGVFLINFGIRKGWLEAQYRGAVSTRRSGIVPPQEETAVGSRLTTHTDAIDTMSFSLGLVLAVYLVTFLMLTALTTLLARLGPAGTSLANNLWGITFIFCMLIALVVRSIFRISRVEHVLEEGSMTRISGVSVDVMVAAALGAISVATVVRFWVPIAILSVAVGLITVFSVIWITSRIFTDHTFHRTILCYGTLTGTLSTGLALLRVVDPEYKTPVAPDYLYASGIVFFLSLPIIFLILSLPSWVHRTENADLYWIAVAVLLAYNVIVFAGYPVLAGRRAFARAGKLWLHDDK